MKEALCALIVLAAAAVGQDAPESRPTSDEKAVALFKKAALVQTPGGKAPVIRDFQASLEVTVHETDKKTQERVRRSASVVEYYRENGERLPLFRRHLRDKLQGTETIHACDGEAYWQKLGQSPARGLAGRESKDERDRIKDEIRRTREFLRFLFLANLDGPGVTFRDGGTREIVANGRPRATEVVVREKAGEAGIELCIGSAGGRPVLYGLSRKLESGTVESIAFSVHEVVESGGVTALVPLVAEYREDGVLTFEARCGARDVKFNANLEDRLFEIPR